MCTASYSQTVILGTQIYVTAESFLISYSFLNDSYYHFLWLLRIKNILFRKFEFSMSFLWAQINIGRVISHLKNCSFHKKINFVRDGSYCLSFSSPPSQIKIINVWDNKSELYCFVVVVVFSLAATFHPKSPPRAAVKSALSSRHDEINWVWKLFRFAGSSSDTAECAHSDWLTALCFSLPLRYTHKGADGSGT